MKGAAQISVIIPTLNEGQGLARFLDALPANLEIIVADGGSRDDTVSVAEQCGVQVVGSAAGRAGQMNAGAALANGEILLFLHADTALPAGAVDAVSDACANARVAGGCFHLGIDSTDPFLHLVADGANLRTRLTGVFYGDQAVWVRRAVFAKMGGFPDLPIMEDYAFSRRLRRHGKVVFLPGRVCTSARRWERENPLFVTFRNWALAALFVVGVSPARLARWYRQVR